MKEMEGEETGLDMAAAYVELLTQPFKTAESTVRWENRDVHQHDCWKMRFRDHYDAFDPAAKRVAVVPHSPSVWQRMRRSTHRAPVHRLPKRRLHPGEPDEAWISSGV